MKNEFYVTRAAESLAGARGKFYFRRPYFKQKFFRTTTPPPVDNSFRAKNFPNEYVVIAFQALYLNFSVLCPKKPISCPLRRDISPKKITGAQQKNSRGPRTCGPGRICPRPCPPSRRPCMLLYMTLDSSVQCFSDFIKYS